MDTDRQPTQAERFAARKARIIETYGQAEWDRLSGGAGREAAFKQSTVTRLLAEKRGQS